MAATKTTTKTTKKTKILDDGCYSPVTSDHISAVADSRQTEVFSRRPAPAEILNIVLESQLLCISESLGRGEGEGS